MAREVKKHQSFCTFRHHLALSPIFCSLPSFLLARSLSAAAAAAQFVADSRHNLWLTVMANEEVTLNFYYYRPAPHPPLLVIFCCSFFFVLICDVCVFIFAVAKRKRINFRILYAYINVCPFFWYYFCLAYMWLCCLWPSPLTIRF